VAVRPHPAVVHGFGGVPVGIEQEGAVVVLAVFRPRPRRARVGVPRRAADLPEGVDVGVRRRAEGQVQPAGGRVPGVRGREREVVPLGDPVLARRLLDLELAEQWRVEGYGRGLVRGAQGLTWSNKRATLSGSRSV
jgi:hypothetical protein